MALPQSLQYILDFFGPYNSSYAVSLSAVRRCQEEVDLNFETLFKDLKGGRWWDESKTEVMMDFVNDEHEI
jgi:hypothetical protein